MGRGGEGLVWCVLMGEQWLCMAGGEWTWEEVVEQGECCCWTVRGDPCCCCCCCMRGEFCCCISGEFCCSIDGEFCTSTAKKGGKILIKCYSKAQTLVKLVASMPSTTTANTFLPFIPLSGESILVMLMQVVFGTLGGP